MGEKAKRKLLLALCGFGIGIINGIMGAGGGLLAVPALKSIARLEPRKAHATSIAVILPLSAISAVLYLYRGYVHLSDVLPFMPGALVGAALGAGILRRMSVIWLRRIFGLFLLYGAYKLWMR